MRKKKKVQVVFRFWELILLLLVFFNCQIVVSFSFVATTILIFLLRLDEFKVVQVLFGLVFLGFEVILRWQPTSCVTRIKALATTTTLEVI